MTLPPEPWLVRWYFEHREQLPLTAQAADYRDKLARNDALWSYICEHGGRPPPEGWGQPGAKKFAANGAALPQDAVDSDGMGPSTSQPVDTQKTGSRDDARKRYQREWVRRRRGQPKRK